MGGLPTRPSSGARREVELAGPADNFENGDSRQRQHLCNELGRQPTNLSRVNGFAAQRECQRRTDMHMPYDVQQHTATARRGVQVDGVQARLRPPTSP